MNASTSANPGAGLASSDGASSGPVSNAKDKAKTKAPKPRRLFRFYARLNRIDDWFERRFTVAGRVVLWTAVGAALFSLDTRRSLAYQMFALAVVMLLVAVIWTARRRARAVQVTRELPALATVGEPFFYRLRVAVPDAVDGDSIWLRERLTGALPAPEAFRRLSEPGASRRTWFDRKLGFPRWIWLARRSRGARTDGVDATLSSHSPTVTRMEMTPLRRGYLEFAGTEVGRADPMGLCRQISFRDLPGRVLALPQRFAIASAVLPNALFKILIGPLPETNDPADG